MPAADSSVRPAPDQARVRRPPSRSQPWWPTHHRPAPGQAAPGQAPPAGGTAGSRTPLGAAQPVLRRLRRTPGQLALLLAATLLCCVGAGLTAGLDVAHRQARLNQMIMHRGPVLDAARDLYRSLSDAHATATVAF